MAQTSPSTSVVTCPFCGYPYPMSDMQREVYRGRHMGCMSCGRPFKVEPPAPPAELAPSDVPASQDQYGDGSAAPADSASRGSSSAGLDSAQPSPSTDPASPAGTRGSAPSTASAPKPRANPAATTGFVCALLFFVLIAVAVICSAASPDTDAGRPTGQWIPRSAAGILTAMATTSAVLAVLFSAAALVRTRHVAGPHGSRRTAGRGVAAAGLALGGGGLLVTMLLLSTVKPLVDRQHELARRESCKTNLQAISAALANYVDSTGGRYPESLADLVASGSLPPGELICPSSTDSPATGATTSAAAAELAKPGHFSYRYTAKGQTRAAPHDAVLVVEPPADHVDICHVLFRDGVILQAGRNQAEQLQRELDAGQNPGPTALLLHP